MIRIENCTHVTTFHGLCVKCGFRVLSNLNRSNRSFQRKLGTNLDCVGGPRFIPVRNENGNLTPPPVTIFSRDSNQVFKDDYRLLRRVQKLRLVLDLDETLIHTVRLRDFRARQNRVEFRTYGDVIDSRCVVIPEVETVYHDNLKKFEGRGLCFEIAGTTYKMMLRPNLQEFLERVSSHYDIFVFTHGTREYAEKVLSVSGCRNYINGIYARENPSCPTVQKDLRKMFCNPQQSIVIDDKSSVWEMRDRENVLMITRYVGDLHDNELFHCCNFLCKLKIEFYQNCFKDVRKLLSRFRK